MGVLESPEGVEARLVAAQRSEALAAPGAGREVRPRRGSRRRSLIMLFEQIRNVRVKTTAVHGLGIAAAPDRRGNASGRKRGQRRDILYGVAAPVVRNKI